MLYFFININYSLVIRVTYPEMRVSKLTALCVFICIHWTAAGRSPHADFIEAYYKNGGPEAGRYSDNILEDAMLDVSGLVTKYRYPIELHTVTTEDGYILEMHRIPYGRDQNNAPDSQKPVVFLMHGLLSSSADWVVLGPGLAFAYLLAEAGYDVWLGNARGNYYSRKHVSLDPDDRKDAPQFWRFSWEEIGKYDIPNMIDYVLETTGKSRLHYVGHSQGTTAFWVMASLKPEYNDKIIAMHAFAPVAFMKHTETPLLKYLGPHINYVESIASIIGINEVLPNSALFSFIGKYLCDDKSMTQPICKNILYYFVGSSDEEMLNSTMLPLFLAHAPAGASVRQFWHYGQQYNQSTFKQYDHGALNNWKMYNSLTPPEFPLERITARVFFHYSDNDVFAHLNDVDTLWNRLFWPIAKIRIPLATFSHLDFVWATGAKRLLYDRVLNFMNVFDN